MDCYIGMVFPIAFTFAPEGFSLCAGQILQVGQNQALYSIVGNLYGGSGNSTFGLPNLIGRFPIGTGASQNWGTFNYGTVGGAAFTTLGIANIPTHTHTPTVNFQTNTVTITIPGQPAAGSLNANVTAKVNNTFGQATPGSGDLYLAQAQAVASGADGVTLEGPYANTQTATGGTLKGFTATVTPSADYRPATASSTAQINTLTNGSVSIGMTGSGVPFTNMPPYLALTFIIATTGLYPTRP